MKKRHRVTDVFEARFPTKKARAIADKAIDDMSNNDPMTAYIDAWIAIYKAAGGIEK